MTHAIQILLVDDNPDDRELARRAISLALPEARFLEAGEAEEFEAQIDAYYDCVITDFRLGWSDGLVVFQRIRERHPDRPVIMFTNTGNEDVCSAGMKSGLSDYIVKRREEFPKLPAAVRTALELVAARRAVRERDEHVLDLLERERSARAEAERANRLKDEFLSTVSHELRTPLGAILGWAQLLQMQRVSRDEELRAFEIIERNAKAQAKLIEDLLDMSRILSGTLRIDMGPADLLAALHAVIDAAQPLAKKKAVTIRTHVDGMPPPVRGDASRLQQIIANLVDNAIKFSVDGGTVDVSLQQTGETLQISVQDGGRGIDPAFLPHIFERFRQSDMGPTRRHGGLGIGLSVTKSLVEMHGGEIEARSEGLGRGACFLVRLPVAVMREGNPGPFEDPAEKSAEFHKLRGLRILVVDDDPDTLDLIRRVLAVHAAEVTGVPSVAKCLERLQAETYDVLLSDIGMPDEDGFALIRKVRALAGPNRNIPASSVTAFARSRDREHALLAGFDAHLVKPVEPGELVAVVLSLIRNQRQA